MVPYPLHKILKSRTKWKAGASSLIAAVAASCFPLQAASTWSLQPNSSNGFQWVAPDGSSLCKFAGASLVDNTLVTRTGQFTDVVPTKYPTWNAWAQAQSDRLKSWGFNSAGQYSYEFQSSVHPANGLPYEKVLFVSTYLADSRFPYHIKTLNHNYSGMVCAPGYLPFGGGQRDAFDPGFASSYAALITTGAFSGNIDKNTVLIVTEEADDLFGIDSTGHEDFGHDIMDGNPRQDADVSNSYTYSDHAVYAKLGLRDFIANKYGCAGSADPADPNYCGATAAANALAALNQAWFGKTVYTTWNTSDAGGLAGLHAGTYATYGTGTGLLDENGTHTLSAATKSNCRLVINGVNGAWTAAPIIESDLHDYVAYFTKVYGQKVSAAWSLVNPHPPIFLPLYNSPSYVYTAAAPYFDGFWISVSNFNSNNRPADVARIVAASSVPGGKSMPLIFADYSAADPDSPFPTSTGGGNLYPTQAAKGAGMVADWQSYIHTKDVNGKYVFVGIEHWPYYDQANEGSDGGLVSADADNAYDGSATNITATTATRWQANTTYTAPSILFDGTNYQALSGGITGSCMSGGTTPNWAVTNGLTTTDGTCTWRNEGLYTLKPEPSITASATIPGKAYGDAITSISNFLKTQLCDPGSTTPPPTSACDVNSDGTINVADVQREVNMAIGISSCTNPSGQCTVVQVQRVVNAALGGTCVAP